MAEKRLIDANELEEKAIYITGPKGSACHAVPLGLIQAAPTIDPETLRPTAHIIRGYVPETKDGVFCDGCNHCLGWEYGAHVIGYFKYCPYCGDRLEDGTEGRNVKVLIACEESQEVCKAFRSLGHEAYSCDVQEPVRRPPGMAYPRRRRTGSAGGGANRHNGRQSALH